MPGLAATGTLAYNGYTFDGATQIDVKTEFVLEDAGRSIKAHRHTITVHKVIDLVGLPRRSANCHRALRANPASPIPGSSKDVAHVPGPDAPAPLSVSCRCVHRRFGPVL